MEYEWDEKKSAANNARHGVGFKAVRGFDWDAAIETIDDREDYGETRTAAIGLIKNRLYVLVYTDRNGVCRVISLRKANQRERKAYEKATCRY